MRKIIIIISLALICGSISGFVFGKTHYYVNYGELSAETYNGLDSWNKKDCRPTFVYNYSMFFMALTGSLGVFGLIGFGFIKQKRLE